MTVTDDDDDEVMSPKLNALFYNNSGATRTRQCTRRYAPRALTILVAPSCLRSHNARYIMLKSLNVFISNLYQKPKKYTIMFESFKCWSVYIQDPNRIITVHANGLALNSYRPSAGTVINFKVWHGFFKVAMMFIISYFLLGTNWCHSNEPMRSWEISLHF